MEEEINVLRKLLENKEWRINNLYWIVNKEGRMVRFNMNLAQSEFVKAMWSRNNILKARQLGFSTLSCILALDYCLFCSSFEAGINDKDMASGDEKMRKIKLAYESLDYLPPNPSERDKMMSLIGQEIKSLKKPKVYQSKKIVFANDSSIRVSTSLRGGTLSFLHVSELGSVAAHDPKKAQEIATGSINSVPQKNSVIILESTHEGGKHGLNYDLLKSSMESNASGELSLLDYKFFFFPWWKDPDYELKTASTYLPKELEDYFKELEAKKISLSMGQKQWYYSQYKVFGIYMRQEYPSCPEEAFEVSIKGAIYGKIISALRSQGKIKLDFNPDPLAPIYAVWDLGVADFMCIWLVQSVGTQYRAIRHYQANNQPISHYINKVRALELELGQKISTHIIPHDSSTRDFTLTSFEGYMRQGGIVNIKSLPRTTNAWIGVDELRRLLPSFIFHSQCSEPISVDGIDYPSGVDCLENYHTRDDGSPVHDIYSHSADALRYFAEAVQKGFITGQNFQEASFTKSRVITGRRFS